MKQILVLSEQQADRWLLDPTGLPALGYAALAGDMAAPLAMLRDTAIELVLLDLPDTAAGLDQLALIRRHVPEIPVLALTTAGTEQLAVAAFRHGARDYLARPFGLAELGAAIHRAGPRSTTPAHAAEQLAALELVVAGVAHELNNPLACIAGYSQLLLRDTSLPPAAYEDITRMLEQAKVAAQVVQGLAAYGRKSAPGRTALNMTQLVERMLELPAADMPPSVMVVRRLSSALPSVLADPYAIQHALLQLVRYARAAVPSGGTITLATWLASTLAAIDDPAPTSPRIGAIEGSAVVTAVTIAGVVVAPEILRTLFGTDDHAAAHQRELAQVGATVEQHGGAVWASSSVERGTTLYLALPPRRRSGSA